MKVRKDVTIAEKAPTRVLLRDNEPLCGPSFQALVTIYPRTLASLDSLSGQDVNIWIQ